MSFTAISRAKADANFHVYTYTLALRPRNSTTVHATNTSTSSTTMVPMQESEALVRSKSERVLEEVKRRHEKAIEKYMGFYKRYSGVAEEARQSQEIPYEQREDCHSEFGSPPGMYEGILGEIGGWVAEAAAALQQDNVEKCIESLSVVVEFLEPIEEKLLDYEKAMIAHEQVEQGEAGKKSKQRRANKQKTKNTV